MPKLKAGVSGFDGDKSYKAGDVIACDVEHARRAVLHGDAVLLDQSDNAIDLADALAALRVPESDLVAAIAAREATKPGALSAAHDLIRSHAEAARLAMEETASVEKSDAAPKGGA